MKSDTQKITFLEEMRIFQGNTVKYDIALQFS